MRPHPLGNPLHQRDNGEVKHRSANQCLLTPTSYRRREKRAPYARRPHLDGGSLSLRKAGRGFLDGQQPGNRTCGLGYWKELRAVVGTVKQPTVNRSHTGPNQCHTDEMPRQEHFT